MQTTAGASLSDDTQQAGTRRRTAYLLVIAAVVLTLDQLTKVWAVSALDGGRVIEVVGEYLRFRLVRNPGAAFSMFTDLTVVLTVIAVAVAATIIWVSRRVTNLAWAVALGGLLGGALGTLSDRMFRQPGPFQGHVVDFIELPNWPVFNVADSSIVGAAALIALLSFRGVAFSSLGRPGAQDVADDTAVDDAPGEIIDDAAGADPDVEDPGPAPNGERGGRDDSAGRDEPEAGTR